MELSIEVFLDESLRPDRKIIRDTVSRIVTVSKKLEHSIQMGDIQAAESNIRQVVEAVDTVAQSGEKLAQEIHGFNLAGYFGSIFPEEFFDACSKEDVHLEGAFPRYKIFPFSVEIIPDQWLALVNEKKVRSLRPSVLARAIRKEKERLEKAPFNAQSFLRALLKCYKLIVAQLRIEKGIPMDEVSVLLKNVHKTLVLLPRWQKEYPIDFFAFDLYRLRKANQTEIDGRVMELGSVRDRRNAIRVVDETGHEHLYGTILFRRK